MPDFPENPAFERDNLVGYGNIRSTPTIAIQSLIGSRILTLRKLRIMLDADLAELYSVQTKVLAQAVKRNIQRFRADFMFQLTTEEFAALRPRTVTLKNVPKVSLAPFAPKKPHSASGLNIQGI